MNALFKMFPWILLLVPFLILAYFYSSLADRILIARSFLGAEVILAPKSPFTVFRVAVIEVVCAALVEIMRRPSRKAISKLDGQYYLFWTILLYTVALKSLLQTVETVWASESSAYIYYLTLSIVIAGVLFAAIAGRTLLWNWRSLTVKYTRLEIVALPVLLIAYLALAFVPVYVFG